MISLFYVMASHNGTESGTMLAYVVEGEAGLLKRVPIPSPGPSECLVKVSRAGICNTDLEILKGYMGFKGILGHEAMMLFCALYSHSYARTVV